MRYELEPELRDVFVEGLFDKDVLTCCFKENDQNNRIVYEIDSVEIPIDLLKSYGLSDGNKQRVIVLAKELAKLSNDTLVRFLVDKDLDDWLNRIEDIPKLIWTKYSSLELYFFSDRVLNDLLLVTAKSSIKDWDQFKTSFVTILRQIYSIRLADAELGWHMELIPREKYLNLNGPLIEFEFDRYKENLLNKNAKASSKKQFEQSLDKWIPKLAGDPRDFIHGHDFTLMLAWAVLKYKGIKAFSSELAIERMLVLLSHRADGILESLNLN